MKTFTEHFTVREELTRDLVDAMANPRAGECIALVGGVVSGRSTVLRTLNEQLGHRAAFVQCDSSLRLRSEEVSEWLRETVAESLAAARDAAAAGPIGGVLPPGRVVLLLDDLDLCLGALSVSDLQWLRELCTQAHVALVVTLRDYLNRLAKSLAHASRFDAIFAATRHCGPLGREEVVRLLRQEWPKGRDIPFEVIDWLRNTAGPHVWFLASLTRAASKRVEKGAEIDGAWMGAVERDLSNRWTGRCQALWNSLSAGEQEVAASIARGETVSGDALEVVRELARLRGVVVSEPRVRLINDTMRVFVDAQERSRLWTGEPTAFRRAKSSVSTTFTEVDRDPDPLYYLGRALERIADPPAYEEANAMLRSAFEQFVVIATKRANIDYKGLTGEGGLRTCLLALAKRCDWEESIVDLIVGVASHLNKQGPHPGKRAFAEDTILRLDAVCDIMILISSGLRSSSAGQARG